MSNLKSLCQINPFLDLYCTIHLTAGHHFLRETGSRRFYSSPVQRSQTDGVKEWAIPPQTSEVFAERMVIAPPHHSLSPALSPDGRGRLWKPAATSLSPEGEGMVTLILEKSPLPNLPVARARSRTPWARSAQIPSQWAAP